MKKEPFLLLEILIAFFLVTLCIVPLVKQPLQLYKSELERLEEMERERLADWTFTEVKEMLIKNEIPWAKFPAKLQWSEPFFLPDGVIEMPGCKPKKVRRSFALKGRGIKENSQKEEIRQIGIYISLDDKIYEFRLPCKNVSK